METLNGVNTIEFPMVEPLDDTDAESEHPVNYVADAETFFRGRMNSLSLSNALHPCDPYGPYCKQHSSFYVKERYLLLRSVENILLSKDGVIFGGYVRDMLLHHHGASKFYQAISEDASVFATGYSDPSVHPSSYKDRNTYPKDIDCFVQCVTMIDRIVSQLAKDISVKVIGERDIHCYTHHPEFTYNFGCKRVCLEYVFNSSFQKQGEKVFVSIDFVYHLRAERKGPWMYLVDPICNMLYMDRSGLHSAFEKGDDVILNFQILSGVVELVVQRYTFVPPMLPFFRMPPQEREIVNIKHTRNCTEMQAVDAYRKHRGTYRILYRLKYLQRISKLVRQGWKITNLGIRFTTLVSEVKSECICAISHEDLKDGEMMVLLGFYDGSNYVQTSVLKWRVFVQYVFSENSRVEDLFGNSSTWKVLCPISRNEVSVMEGRSVSLVLKEALHICRLETETRVR